MKFPLFNRGSREPAADTVKARAEAAGVPYGTVKHRLWLGLTLEEALIPGRRKQGQPYNKPPRTFGTGKANGGKTSLSESQRLVNAIRQVLGKDDLYTSVSERESSPYWSAWPKD